MKLIKFGICSLMCLALATTAFAQAEQYDVGLFGDPAGTLTSLNVSQFSPFQVYLIAFDLDGLVKGFESYINVPPEITVTGSIIAGPAPIKPSLFQCD